MGNLTRRQFIKLLAAAAAALSALLVGWLPRAAFSIRRILRARPAPTYPGRVAPLDRADVPRPGPWAG